MQFKKIILVMFAGIMCYAFDLSQLTDYSDHYKIPSNIKEFAPHTAHICQMDSHLIFEVKGFLYITKKLCGIESNIAINCPNVQYSVRLGIADEAKTNPFLFDTFNVSWYQESPIAEKCQIKLDKPFFQTPSEKSFQGFGMFLQPNQYAKIQNIHPHIEKELENKAYLLIPVHLKIHNITLGYLTSVPYHFGLFDIQEILPLTEQEKQNLLNQICKNSQKNIVSKLNYCTKDLSDDRIYPFSKDLSINMREKPNPQSKVIARLVSVAPKGEEYEEFIAGENSLSDSNFPVFGFLFPISKYETHIDADDVNNLSWLVNRARFLQKNPDVKIVKAQTIYILRNYGFVDNEQIELYVKGLPKDDWYKVYYTDKKGKKVEGYIHKSQLSWGF